MQPPTRQEINQANWQAIEKLYGISKQQIPFCLWDDNYCFQQIKEWVKAEKLPIREGAIAPLTLKDLLEIKPGDWNLSTPPIEGTFEHSPFGIWTFPSRISKIFGIARYQLSEIPAELECEIYIVTKYETVIKKKSSFIEGATCFLMIPTP